MKSKWFDKKQEAINLRKKGYSIRDVEVKLKIPRSTLSGWFKNVELSKNQKEKLFKKWKMALVNAREKAIKWHNEQKEKRLVIAKEEAKMVLENINFQDKNVINLALAMLYLGEGGKSAEETSLGNSDPLILKAFINILKADYGVDIKKIRCDLNLRADQNIEEIKMFWSQELALPLENFKSVAVDKRTIGSKTYSTYKGVCNIRYGNVAIKRKLLNIGRIFCEKIISRA